MKLPVAEAIGLVTKAVEIAYRYKWDERHLLTPDELQHFHMLEDSLHAAQATVAYITRCMEKRLAGEPEGSDKWHKDHVFDYHYPP